MWSSLRLSNSSVDNQKRIKQMLMEAREKALHDWISCQLPIDTIALPLYMLHSNESSSEQQHHQPIGG